jgi:transmembrane sensor
MDVKDHSMNHQRNEVLIVATQAANWLHIMQTKDLRDDAGFLRWLRESPLHVKEYLLAYRMDEKLKAMDPERRIDVEAILAELSPNVLPIGIHMSAPVDVVPRRKANRWGMAVAACAAVIALGFGITRLVIDSDGDYVTKVGEQRTFELPDGSVVWLNTNSRIRTSLSKDVRKIDLLYGQAMFEVAHDAARPFKVFADSSVIQAIGTQFDVRREGAHVAVSVVEGTVQVMSIDPKRPPASEIEIEIEPTRITAGEGATVTSGGKVSAVAHIDAEAATAWRQQQLVFEDTPLAEIVSEFNRYNRTPQLQVEGPEVGALRYNGVFGARNPESLLTYLSKAGAVTFERRGDEVIIRARVESTLADSPDSSPDAQQ